MLCHHLGKNVAKVRRHRQIASFIELLGLETGPLPVNLPACHAPAHHEHAVGVTMIRPARAILRDGATKLRHRDEYNIFHPFAKVIVQSADPLRQLAESAGELTLRAALREVRVPPTYVCKCDLHANIGLNELCDLAQRATEVPGWISDSLARLILRGIRLFENLDGLERIAGSSAD